MSPADWQALTDAVQRVGVLGLAVLAILALYREWVVPRSRMDKVVAEVKEAAEKEVASERERREEAERRRAEERDARLQAEARLASLVKTVENLGDVIREVKEEVVRGSAYAAASGGVRRGAGDGR